VRSRETRIVEWCATPISTLLLCTFALLGTSWARAGTMDREVEFHTSEGPLESALLQLSKQANVPLTLAAYATGELRTPGLAGRLAVRVALEMLLRDSGLSYATMGDTVTITRSPAAPSDPPNPALDSAGAATKQPVPRQPAMLATRRTQPRST
jgi:hypothetical protein